MSASRITIKDKGGWFDKFTGDGFLAYWLYDKDDEWIEAMSAALTCVRALQFTFYEMTLPEVRANSHNFPDGVGLSFGIDEGPAYMAIIADDLTIVGKPVVGAIRMNSTATAWELICNVAPGIRLLSDENHVSTREMIHVMRGFRGTKEYESQEVYSVQFLPETRAPQPGISR